MELKATRAYQTLEPEHLVWGLSRAALVIGCIFLPVLIFSPGLVFWVDLLKVIPIMLMGGMCSESMMIRILTSLVNLGIVVTAFVAMRALTRKIRFAFDHAKHGGRTGLWELPGPTVWQARLHDVQIRCQSRRTDTARLF